MTYKAGTWNVVCAVCGFDKNSDEVKQRWDGPYVCTDTCWEPRHVLDFFTPPPPEKQIPWSQNVDEDYRITPTTTQAFGVATLDASLTDTIFQITPGAIISVRLPSANDDAFREASVVYIVYNTGTVTSLVVDTPVTGAIDNRTAILAGGSGRFRSIPAHNLWIREG